MSKTPVQRTSASKPAAKKPAPAAKASAKSPAKASSTAKPAAKAVSKPAAKAAQPPVQPKSTPTAVPTKPAPKTESTPAKPAARTAAAPVAETTVADSSVVKASSPRVAAARAAAAPPAAPIPPATSRFADRFAPPRPPTRQMNSSVIDVTKTPHKADPKLANAWKTKSGAELTEAEVLAMPDSEYMKDKQIEFFRAKLQSLKDDLLSNAGETTEHLREDTSIVPDPADRATIEEEHALELRTRDRERKLLKKIAQSLVRLDSGDYGFCDETGEPIGLGRLIARPTATLSLEAQQRRELKQKMFGD
ncbi:RNA polymerase-binding protein DksA [Rhizobacter sp. Root1221]|uniref:RNA polymerase-binding protein DksA n=1 Tax=Rhizobacter sp. Root1221 TaxID=1736433 RepID=UPI001F3FF6EE|nr:RNA polymerase-binding protein DksA [Rhizobacter sp. Root1221]